MVLQRNNETVFNLFWINKSIIMLQDHLYVYPMVLLFHTKRMQTKGLWDREWHGQVSHGTGQDANSTVVPVRFSIWHRSVYTTRWSKWQSWLSTNVWNFIRTQGTGFTAQIMFLKPISALLSECQHDCLLTVLSKNSFINDFILSDKCGLDDDIKMNFTLCWWEYC